MGEPTIELLGIYRVNVTDELCREQLSIQFPYVGGEQRSAAECEVRTQLESVVLIEALVRDRDERFDAGDFAQGLPGVPASQWQVAWAETYLSADGTTLATERWSPAPEAGDLRIVFFMHFWDAGLPLLSSYGEVPCPAPQRMPERLERLAPYEPVD